MKSNQQGRPYSAPRPTPRIRKECGSPRRLTSTVQERSREREREIECMEESITKKEHKCKRTVGFSTVQDKKGICHECCSHYVYNSLVRVAVNPHAPPQTKPGHGAVIGFGCGSLLASGRVSVTTEAVWGGGETLRTANSRRVNQDHFPLCSSAEIVNTNTPP